MFWISSIILLIVSFILGMGMASGWSNTTFNNSLDNELISFSAQSSFLRYLSVPENILVTSGLMNLTYPLGGVPPFSGSSLFSGTTAYWKFDETSGTNVQDHALGINNGTISNVQQLNQAGVLNTAMNINGTGLNNMSVLTSQSLNFTNTNFSVSFWINATTGASGSSIFQKRSGNSILMRYNWNDSVGAQGHYFQFDNGTDTDFIVLSNSTSSGFVNLGVFQHVAVVYNGKNLTVYVNGTFAGNRTYSGNLGSNIANLTFSCAGAPCTDGATLDEMGVWNRSLSFSEITQLYGGETSGEINLSVGSSVVQAITVSNATDPTNLTITTPDLASYINTYVSTCTIVSGFCLVPFNFSSTVGDVYVRYHNMSFDNTEFIENSQSFNALTSSGSLEHFSINITYDTSYFSSISSLLRYNNTLYASTPIGSGNNRLFNASVIIPGTTSAVDKTLLWEFSLTNQSGAVIYLNSTSNTQTINPVGIDNCSSFTQRILNFSLFDEDLRTTPINGTIEVIVELYTPSTDNLITSFNKSYSVLDGAGAEVCLQNTNGTSDLFYQAKYFGNTSYTTEYKYAQAIEVTNNTVTQNISLYNLLDARSTAFNIILRAEDLSKIQGAVVDIQRQYVPISQYVSVESPLTDSDGVTLGHLVADEIYYNFIVSKNGTTLGTFNSYRVKCQNIVIGDCRIELNLIESTSDPTDFSTYGNISFNYLWAPISRVLTLNFLSTDSVAHTVAWNVTQLNGYGNVSLCSNTASGTSGTFTCNIATSYGNTSILAELYSDGTYLGSDSFSFGQSGQGNIFGGTRVVLGILFYSVLVLLLSFNPVAMIIGGFLGMGFSAGFYLIEGGSLIGNTLIFGWWFIAGVIIIVYIAKITKKGVPV
jgi:hypothetical protein